MMIVVRQTWDEESNYSVRGNPDVHYRLYLSPRDDLPTVICVQDFDYVDYQVGRFLSEESYDTEEEAVIAGAEKFPEFFKVWECE